MAANTIDWEYWYHKLMSHAHEDESMRDAINTIDQIHEKCGAFKYMDEEDRRNLNWALDKLAGASDYELYTAFEEMSDYFGFNDLEESKNVKSIIRKLNEAVSSHAILSNEDFNRLAAAYQIVDEGEADQFEEWNNVCEELGHKYIEDPDCYAYFEDHYGAYVTPESIDQLIYDVVYERLVNEDYEGEDEGPEPIESYGDCWFSVGYRNEDGHLCWYSDSPECNTKEEAQAWRDANHPEGVVVIESLGGADILNESTDQLFKAKVDGKWLKGKGFTTKASEAEVFESETEPTQRINQMKKSGKIDKDAKIDIKSVKDRR